MPPSMWIQPHDVASNCRRYLGVATISSFSSRATSPMNAWKPPMSNSIMPANSVQPAPRSGSDMRTPPSAPRVRSLGQRETIARLRGSRRPSACALERRRRSRPRRAHRVLRAGARSTSTRDPGRSPVRSRPPRQPSWPARPPASSRRRPRRSWPSSPAPGGATRSAPPCRAGRGGEQMRHEGEDQQRHRATDRRDGREVEEHRQEQGRDDHEAESDRHPAPRSGRAPEGTVPWPRGPC